MPRLVVVALTVLLAGCLAPAGHPTTPSSSGPVPPPVRSFAQHVSVTVPATAVEQGVYGVALCFSIQGAVDLLFGGNVTATWSTLAGGPDLIVGVEPKVGFETVAKGPSPLHGAFGPFARGPDPLDFGVWVPDGAWAGGQLDLAMAFLYQGDETLTASEGPCPII